MARGRGKTQDVKRMRFAAIPLIVLVLILVIMVTDRGEEKKKEDSSLSAAASSDIDHQSRQENGKTGKTEENGEAGKDRGEPQTSPAEDESTQAPQDPSQYPLQQDSILELTGLVRLYCEAKTECDPELLAQVFGIQDWTEEKKSEEREGMELVKASIKSYENISCYSLQGPEADSYVIFPYYEILYRGCETLMPAISWAYVRKNDAGQYYMVEEPEESINEYVRKTGEKPEVKAVMAQVQAKQQEALAADPVLQKVYGGQEGSEVLINGR